LTVGEPARVQKLRREHGWEKGQVKRVLPYRSYEVEVNGNQVVRRNRRHIRVSKSGKSQKAVKGDTGTSTTARPKLKEKGSTEKSRSEIVLEPRARPQHQDKRPTMVSATAITRTRSGRVVKKTRYLEDYSM
jgi:hypothetical protein